MTRDQFIEVWLLGFAATDEGHNGGHQNSSRLAPDAEVLLAYDEWAAVNGAPTDIELELFRRGRKIDAIKSYRTRNPHVGLRESLALFEKLT